MSLTTGQALDQTRLRRLQGSIPASYTVFKSGTTYYAESCIPGGTDYSDPDAATVIQAALNAGGKPFLKDATYPLTSPLTIAKAGVVIEGESRSGTILDGDSLDDYAIIIGDGVTDFNPGPRISSLSIKGGIKSWGHDVADTDLGPHSLWFEDLRIETSLRYGIYIINYVTQPIVIRDCVIAECELGGIYVSGDSCGIYVEDNMFGRNKVNDIAIVRDSYGRPRDIVIENNMFEHFTTSYPATSVYLYGADSVWVTKNHIVDSCDPTLDAILVTGNVSDENWWSIRAFINYNWIYQTNIAKIRHGIHFDGAKRSSAIGNTIVLGGNNPIITSADTKELRIALNDVYPSNALSIAGTLHIVKNNRGYPTENSGSSTGTGGEQTIAHGLVSTPTKVVITPTASGATISTLYADATNIYVTVTINKTYNWDASVG